MIIYSYKVKLMTKDQCDRRIIHGEVVAQARIDLKDYSEIEEKSELFKALADPGRLQIVIALASREMCVCDLAALLGVSESAASHQMRILRSKNLVKSRRDGQVLYYRLVDDHVMQLVDVARMHVKEMKYGEADV